MATRSDPPFKARLPGDLRMRIEAAANTNGRSINAEIVSRLEDSFADKPILAEDQIQRISGNISRTSSRLMLEFIIGFLEDPASNQPAARNSFKRILLQMNKDIHSEELPKED